MASAPDTMATPPQSLGAAMLRYCGLLLLAALPLALLWSNPYWVNILAYTYLFAALAAAWNIIGGFGGQFSLGHGVFFAIGAYTVARFYLDLGVTPWLGIFPAAALATIIALLISWPTFRLRGPFFAIATMAINEACFALANYSDRITGGPRGILIPSRAGLSNMIFIERWKYALLMFGFMAIVVLITVWLRRARLGHYLMAIRADEDAAGAAGINVLKAKLQGMALSAFLTGIGGGLFAMYVRVLDPPSLFTLPDIGVKFALIALIGGIGTLALIIYLLIGPFVDQTNQFVDDVPSIVHKLENVYADVTGQNASDVGNKVQTFVERYTDHPDRLIGPLTSIGLNVAGILGALVLILITSYYMAIRPEPLVNGLVRLFPPPRREHVRFVLGRVRQSWIGWLEGVAIDMLVTFVMLYVALTIVGLDFAIFFAVLSALLVVVPYFGAIAGAIPPVLFALTDSPGKAVVVLIAYILVQQLESNVTIPIIMAQRVRLHPAVIAIGVVVVGRLFGFIGLFVAVPILSLIIIAVEEFWVKPVEEGYAAERRSEITLPEPVEQQISASPEQGEAPPLRPAS
jgi:branched-chain amino acid transport system permease protein